ncbi:MULTISPECIES: hypothetical protein [Pseudomonas]|jgi:hypothetical protein|uniref:hypothetical protein n=1 Tax=Pseudomonas TaxID=286 RepID=UPI00115BF483|nr:MULTISPECIES: hypothetical protein [Pseudomonas]ELQ8318171.1 hypothetical protein [Pseudomonas aeruginosa]MBU5733074.1 hypothetical protein [Pseudomonas aeruginosa]UUJ38951.1 hypothetical protein L1A22_19685 [Pseudomonas extremaustralis]HDQ4470827.1 hypothetical protein [Pseudomonas aeruginosa]
MSKTTREQYYRSTVVVQSPLVPSPSHPAPTIVKNSDIVLTEDLLCLDNPQNAAMVETLKGLPMPMVIPSLVHFMINALRTTGLDIDWFCRKVGLQVHDLNADETWTPRVKLYRLYKACV